MYKTLILYTLITFAQCIGGISQNKILLVKAEGQYIYLLAHIEEYIRTVREATTDSVMFKKIISLNRLIDVGSDRKDLRNVANIYDPTMIVDLSDEARTNDSTYLKTLSQHTNFLKIYINPLNELIEYQFLLYNRKVDIDAINNKRLKLTISGEPFKVVNVIIDPRSERYRTNLNDAISTLFPTSNKKPVPVVLINGAVPKSGYAVGQELYLDGAKSSDKETGKENLIFSWIQEEGVSLNLEKANPSQTTKVTKPGIYKIQFSVSDGILDSALSIDFDGIQRPIISIDKHRYVFVTQMARFKRPDSLRSVLGVAISDPKGYDVLFLPKSFQLFREQNVIAKRLRKGKVGVKDSVNHVSFFPRKTPEGYMARFSVPDLNGPRDYEYSVFARKKDVDTDSADMSVQVFSKLFMSFGWEFKSLFNEIHPITGDTLNVKLEGLSWSFYLSRQLGLNVFITFGNSLQRDQDFQTYQTILNVYKSTWLSLFFKPKVACAFEPLLFLHLRSDFGMGYQMEHSKSYLGTGFRGILCLTKLTKRQIPFSFYGGLDLMFAKKPLSSLNVGLLCQPVFSFQGK